MINSSSSPPVGRNRSSSDRERERADYYRTTIAAGTVERSNQHSKKNMGRRTQTITTTITDTVVVGMLPEQSEYVRESAAIQMRL